ncbi:hypothetical protein HG15A2_26150 [Adhaeretor mobilis]|uniref:Uncharacterized protein n=1 Tax=Adhaeretor mobilis TaxID=1930276 RepID=A0A517MWN4_9BACT|nr:hypothetical protein HG15A2_26150 [Adhaeretor mobilis]
MILAIVVGKLLERYDWALVAGANWPGFYYSLASVCQCDLPTPLMPQT